jgi:hypothetical protein
VRWHYREIELTASYDPKNHVAVIEGKRMRLGPGTNLILIDGVDDEEGV